MENNQENRGASIAQNSLARKKRNRGSLNAAVAALLLVLLGAGAVLLYSLMPKKEEKTDVASVAGHLVQLTPQVGGTVRKVMFDDADVVKKGDVVVTLDDSDFQLAYERAQNELVQAIRKHKQQTADTAQTKAQVLLKKAELARAQADLDRRRSLEGTDAVSGEELSHARAAVVQAQAALKAAEAEETAAQAALGSNIPLRQQPEVQTAVSKIKDAWLNLQRTQIRAPIAGQIARRNVQLGQRISQGEALMAVVPLQNLWVEAAFQEAQLRKMRIGQPVKMTAELYGRQVVYRGKVMGLAAGSASAVSKTGAQPEQVPSQVPVRISLDAETLRQYPLRVGLSMKAAVDVSDAGSGKSMTAAVERDQPLPEADVVDWAAADALIEKIFEKYAK